MSAAIFEGEELTFDIRDSNGHLQTIDSELPDLSGWNIVDAT